MSVNDLEGLTRRLKRERAARLEAESIAERSTRALYDRQQELVLLEAVATASNEAVDVTDALRLALERVCRHLGWSVGYAYRVDASTRHLVFAGAEHLVDGNRFAAFAKVSRERTFACGEGLPGRVLASGVPVWIEDVVIDGNFPRASEAAIAGLHEAIAFPILVDGGVEAVLECFSEQVGRPSPELLWILAQAGVQLSRVIERARAEERLSHDATHDQLTGLANRTMALDHLALALARRARGSATAAVLFVDLDRFKLVNDSFGHPSGDQLLIAIADRLGQAERPSDTVARLSGDEFLVLCDPVDGIDDAIKIAYRIQGALADPVEVGDDRIHLGASIGVAVAGPDSTGEGLIQEADAAMYQAKGRGRGRGRVEIFNDDMRDRVFNRLRTEREFEAALDREEFRVFYQPLVAIDTNCIVGVEALVRWQHPRRGLLLPDEFISLAEETGMIVPMGRWVLEQVCRQARAWEDAGIPNLEVAVNLSGRQLAQWDLVPMVATMIAQADFDPCRIQLCLEITESVLMVDPDGTAAILKDLRALGVSLAIDDFGTGYSSLASLQSFPVDVVKIDQSFVACIDTDDATRAIVDAVCHLARALHLSVVAEGVETVAQLDQLRGVGCDIAQGFLFARPTPPDQLALDLSKVTELHPGR